ncbi:MAG: PrsW family intramembrane metalloprotease [Anaerolineales bacterium]|jgi:RsiW-degrading membrane proteinase PrsW (M82 family)|nr:PrsW family intramembrane metalloprotease [Chloroflexota bacterium]MBK6647912.1 PrsW family intramembrane metalloprotease [Anaerolineales bacterium]MCC6987015.1 PrsW family intramembrane metalloprotease [Anaerolineales bacterium]
MALLAAIPMAFIPAFFFSWFIYWLDRYEKEPRWLLLATFFWGGFVAIIGTLIIATVFEIGFSIVLNDAALENIAGGSITAPIVEEFMKGLAVMIVFFLFRKEFDSILDGIIYGGIAGLGFAATENVFYFLSQYSDAGWGGMFTNFALRVGVFAWGHPFYTAFTGLGFAVARTNRNTLIKFAAPVIGYILAVLAHSFHNTSLVFVSGLGSFALVVLLEWAGWLIFLGFIAWLIRHEQGLLKKHLREEVASGLISEAQFKTAVSFFQFGARMAALSGGAYKATDHFYQYLGELAHKKEQFEKFGDEKGNAAIIQQHRESIRGLAAQAKT